MAEIPFWNENKRAEIKALRDSVGSRPIYHDLRQSFLGQIEKDSAVLSKFSPQEIIHKTSSFEELTSLSGYLQEREGGNKAFWDLYHNKRIEHAKNPSHVGGGKYVLPVRPQVFYRSDVSGPRGIGVSRNIIGDTFTLGQMQGKDPIHTDFKGQNYSEFLKDKKIHKSRVVFDLETSGLLEDFAKTTKGPHTKITSLGIVQQGGAGTQGLFLGNLPSSEAPYLGEFYEQVTKPGHLRMESDAGAQAFSAMGGTTRKVHQSNTELISTLMKTLNTDKNAALVGYNSRMFDELFVGLKAEEKGLGSALKASMAGRETVDVGDYAKAFLSEQLGSDYVGWQDKSFSELNLNPKGWKQQALAHSFGMEGALSSSAHTPYFDAKMTDFLYGKLTDDEGRVAAKEFSLSKYKEGLVHVGQTQTELSEFEKLTVQRGGKTYLDLPKEIIPTGDTRTLAQRLTSKSAIGIDDFKYTGKEIYSAGKNWVKGLGKAGKVGLGVGAGLVGLGLIGQAFSGKDDYYNTIEGLKHGGLAEGIRRSHTEFGSGWRGGLPSQLMGVPIDDEILEFREDVIDGGNYQDILDEIERKQKLRQQELGDFYDTDYMDMSDLGTIQGINQRNQALRQISLDKFNINVEDADTLILNRKGIFGFSDPMAKEVQVRLAGIDAPEVAGHAGDPLEDVRYQQEQPGGTEATEALQDLISQQDDLSLVIGGEKTYGRYVGALIGDDSVLNVDLARMGAVSALPFGSASKDVVSRSEVERAEDYAREEGAGIWGMARYQAIGQVHDSLGQAVTFNTLTRIDKLAKNLNVGAYGSFLGELGDEERRLTYQEEDIASRIGYALRKTHGPKKRAYNQFEGLHPGSNGMGAWSIRSGSDFGSMAVIKAGLGKVSGAIGKGISKFGTKASKGRISKLIKESDYPIYERTEENVRSYLSKVLISKGQDPKTFTHFESNVKTLMENAKPVASSEGILLGKESYYTDKAREIITANPKFKNRTIEEIASKYKETTIMHETIESELVKGAQEAFGGLLPKRTREALKFGGHAARAIIPREIRRAKSMGNDYFEIMKTIRQREVTGVKTPSEIAKGIEKLSDPSARAGNLKEIKRLNKKFRDAPQDDPNLAEIQKELKELKWQNYRMATVKDYNAATLQSAKRRTQNFNAISQSAHGSGLRAAHNGGKGHYM